MNSHCEGKTILWPSNLRNGLAPLQFSLRATIDHHTFRSLYCIYQLLQKNILLQRSHNYGVWNYWQQKLLYCRCYTIWIDWHTIFGLEQEGGGLVAPMALAHPLHPIDNRSGSGRRGLWVGWCVSSWWPLFPSRGSVLMFIYICNFYMSSVFFGLPIVSCSDDNSLIPGCLWLLAFVLNNTLILVLSLDLPSEYRIQHGAIGPLMSHLATQLGYSAGVFQALQLMVLATFGVVD